MPSLQIRTTDTLLTRIDRAAEGEGVLRNTYVLAAVLKALQYTEAAQQRAQAKASYDGVPL